MPFVDPEGNAAAPANPLYVSPIDGGKASYSFAIAGLVPAATPTDVFNITGSATKTIRVTRLVISGLQTTAGIVDMLLIKRSGGTEAVGTAGVAVANDSNSAAATALVQTYTANPATLGTAVGTIFAGKIFVPNAAAAASADKLILDYGVRPAQAQVLRGATQLIALNLNSITLTGGSLDISIEWTEE